MQEQMRVLVALQQVDQQIREVEAEITALPRRLTETETTVKTAQARLDAAGSRLKEQETLRRRLEGDIADLRQKIVKYRAQTDSVKTNEQYKALLHEISFAEQEISAIETRELESMEVTEGLETEQASLKAEVESAKKSLAEAQQYVRAAADRLHAQLTAERTRRNDLRSQSTPEWLAKFDTVAKSRKTALAEAVEGECRSCHMRLRPHHWNQLRAGEELKCESCGRILYYDEGNDQALAAKAAGHIGVP